MLSITHMAQQKAYKITTRKAPEHPTHNPTNMKNLETFISALFPRNRERERERSKIAKSLNLIFESVVSLINLIFESV